MDKIKLVLAVVWGILLTSMLWVFETHKPSDIMFTVNADNLVGLLCFALLIVTIIVFIIIVSGAK